MRFLGWLLGLDNVKSIDQVDIALAAPWAQENLFWVFFGCVALAVVALVFYLRYQPRGSRRARIGLGLLRAAVLILLFLTLANPVLEMTTTQEHPARLFVLVDGSDSMRIEDEYAGEERDALQKSLPGARDPSGVSRQDLLSATLASSDSNWLDPLQGNEQVEIETFVFDGPASKLRKVGAERDAELDGPPKLLAALETSSGPVTAIGRALGDVRQQLGAGHLAGVVMVSDFTDNSNTAPERVAAELGVPVYTVGIGAVEAADVIPELQMDPKMKKAERTSIIVKLRHAGMEGRGATVRVTARKLGGAATETIVIGEQQTTLSAGIDALDFDFTPDESGRFQFTAEVDPIDGEVDSENNRTQQDLTIIDDYLRLMYVAFEPTWEWRFVKEVFHRDKLVGMDGFRTYLASSDPRVRQNNVLFLPTLTPQRSTFFANDVLFVGDMPGSALSERFCEMAREFVSEHGGGLVIIGGPRFGPGELAATPLAEMLPVLLDDRAELEDRRPFAPRLTADAQRYPFMQLGDSDVENQLAWNNLGKLPWYQPVAAVHDQAVVLAEHPTDKCADGRTPQPLIAIRRYGNGEVVYLAFNEMWRLRRLYGERFYRRFWSQLIYRLGMSHALGADKRFRPALDDQHYRPEQVVRFTVAAYDENYEPLTAEDVAGGALEAELTLPQQDTGGSISRSISVPLLRNGVFEARIPVYTPGEYSIRVRDPVTNQFQERRFDVQSVSAERLNASRDLEVQNAIARVSGGRSYDLTNVSRLVEDLKLKPRVEVLTRNHPLWTTPLWFGCLVLLMLSEWFTRKMLNLA